MININGLDEGGIQAIDLMSITGFWRIARVFLKKLKKIHLS
jgi:hypothetical protein